MLCVTLQSDNLPVTMQIKLKVPGGTLTVGWCPLSMSISNICAISLGVLVSFYYTVEYYTDSDNWDFANTYGTFLMY